MSRLDVRTVDLRALNSLTKYPSIPTYHALDPRDGGLLAECVAFTGPVTLTEKVDGTNARIVVLPDGAYLVGSREELLCARGDLIGNPALGIVDALRDVAERLSVAATADRVTVFYLEVYGGRVTAASRQYTAERQVGHRLFDVAVLDDPSAPCGAASVGADPARRTRPGASAERADERVDRRVGRRTGVAPASAVPHPDLDNYS
ncbi:RNA ligase family protein [Micromonospora echinofusca]|uniref:RNA ligase family protein n=1 Tax=Micromonospora echinofusca TaxID=47858 RepID=UPI0033E92D66